MKIEKVSFPTSFTTHRENKALGTHSFHKIKDSFIPSTDGDFHHKVMLKGKSKEDEISSSEDKLKSYIDSLSQFASEVDKMPLLSDGMKRKVKNSQRILIADIKDMAENLNQKNIYHGKDNLMSALESTLHRIDLLKGKKVRDKDIVNLGLDSPIPNFGRIKEGVLYRGSQPYKKGLLWLSRQGIKTVVNLREKGREDEYGFSNFNREAEKELCKKLGIKYVEISIKDRSLPTSEDVYKFLDCFKEKPVYVHCAAGVGRTSIMVSLYQTNVEGKSVDQTIKESNLYGLDPSKKPDHRTQVEFIKKNTPLPPRNPVLKAFAENRGIIQKHTPHDTSHMWEDINESALYGHSYEIDGNLVTINGKEYLVNAHDPEAYKEEGKPFPDKPENLNPAPLLRFAKERNVFIKFDFKNAKVIDVFANLGKDIPPYRKMGHAFVKELEFGNVKLKPFQEKEQIPLKDVKRAKSLLGNAPFEVSCRGISLSNLNFKLVDEIAHKVKGIAEVVNFNLPKGEKVPVSIAKYMWNKYKIATEVKIDSPKDKDRWDKAGIPYFGTSDNPKLATVFE